jgi:hypothetical protein
MDPEQLNPVYNFTSSLSEINLKILPLVYRSTK